MSSILNALKKLEDQSPPWKDAFPEPIPIKRTVIHQARDFLRFRRILFVAAGTFLLGILGGTLWYRMPIVSQPAANPIPSRMPVNGQATTPMQADSIPPPTVPPGTKTSLPPSTPNTALKNQPPSPAFQEPPWKDTRAGETGHGPALSTPRADPVLPASQPAPAVAEVKPMEDGRLNMQALTWSSDAEECFAVINNSIVRAGETVEGFVVTHIDTDFVVVERGDEKWALRFGLR